MNEGKKKRRRNAPRWIRDGTIWGPRGTEIDLNFVGTGDWITVKCLNAARCEGLAARLLNFLNGTFGTKDEVKAP